MHERLIRKFNKILKRFQKIPQEIPLDFLKVFDEKSYLDANPDIADAVSRGNFTNGRDHFVRFGYKEVEEGKRRIGMLFPYYKEKIYLQHNPDLQEIKKQQPDFSLFTHFLAYGYREFLEGKREISDIPVYNYLPPVWDINRESNIKRLLWQPLVSVIMPVYNVDPKWLELAVLSLQNQWYREWELCIVDDASTREDTKAYLQNLDDSRIKIMFLKQNLGISEASNRALSLAEGEYVALMDNDDELTPDALYEVVKAINRYGAEFIYSDEDKIELNGTYSDVHFKPDFSPDMFFSQNYLSHLGVMKKELIQKVGGWETGLEGSQDYDLYLKVLEQTDQICHIPKVLYHWRKVPGSTAAKFSDKSYAQEAGRSALQHTLQRRKIDAVVDNGKYPGTYRVKYTIKERPLISIIIPFKDKPELLDMCVNSILDKSTYLHYEIIGISNNSEELETFEMMKYLEGKSRKVAFYEYNIPFNYSAINNYAVSKYAKGEQIVLLNNDIEIITSDWMESMLEFSQREDVGAVGAKLYYPDDTIQHAGISVGPLRLAGHNFRHLPKDQPGYMGRESVVQNVSAVTTAMLMVKKTVYEELEGLNEENLKVAFNDVDFCLRIREKGYLNVYTPYCEAYHYESVSRGPDNTPENRERFSLELEFMQSKWHDILKNGDPYYNPNLTLEREDFTIKQEKEG